MKYKAGVRDGFKQLFGAGRRNPHGRYAARENMGVYVYVRDEDDRKARYRKTGIRMLMRSTEMDFASRLASHFLHRHRLLSGQRGK